MTKASLHGIAMKKMVRTCSILVDDLSFFEDCNRVIQTSIFLVDFAVDFDFDLGLWARPKSVSNFVIPWFQCDFARF